ncbi:ROK family protein [Lacticaseibacillus kribbianus]|uniref:ROK family protein n=1 Tax=Lacticaseibacillus kribbianus TaxID=2926292 RepID=UPI001CD2FE9E|nr:ROK family protein [Lacticaseibacillus kribbianus]
MRTDKNLLRVLNEKRVLTEAFNRGTISRSQISKNIGLNKVTVSDVVTGLIEKGYLIEQGQGDSTHNGGRKPTILTFNRDLGYIVTMDWGYDYLVIAAARLTGELLVEEGIEITGRDFASVLQLITDWIADYDRATPPHLPLLGIVIAVHGIVHHNRVTFSPFIDMNGVDIARVLEERFTVPVRLQNEANLSAVYERDFERRREDESLVCISIHKGIGAGIIIHGKLYTGRHGEAGEIGHTVVYDHAFFENGKTTTIESICSETALVENVRAELNDPTVTRDQIIALSRQGDPVVLRELARFCRYIANVIYNITVALDPRRVMLNSGLIAKLPELLDQIRKDLPSLTAEATEIDLVDDVRHCILLGGCAMLTHDLLNVESGQLTFGTQVDTLTPGAEQA